MSDIPEKQEVHDVPKQEEPVKKEDPVEPIKELQSAVEEVKDVHNYARPPPERKLMAVMPIDKANAVVVTKHQIKVPIFGVPAKPKGDPNENSPVTKDI